MLLFKLYFNSLIFTYSFLKVTYVIGLLFDVHFASEMTSSRSFV